MNLTRKFKILPFVVSLAILVLQGCASTDVSRFEGLPPTNAPDRTSPDVGPDSNDEAAEEEARPQARIFRGNDRFLSESADDRPEVRLTGDAVSLNFERVPLEEVVHAILGDVLDLDYAISQPLPGEVSLRTQRPIDRASLLTVLETTLQNNGLVLVRDPDGVYQVGSPEALKSLAPSNVRTGNIPAGFGNLIVPLQYVGAEEMARILRSMASKEAVTLVDPVRNLLVLTGTGGQLESWSEIVASFDVDLMAGMSVGVFPVEYANVLEVNDALSLLIGDSTAGEGQSAGGPLRGMIRVIPLERLNSLLVVTPRAHLLDRVSQWIARLDVPEDNAFETQLFVYPVQNGQASHLAALLSSLFEGGGSGSRTESPSRPAARQVAPGLEPVNLDSGNQDSDGAAEAPSMGDSLPDTSPRDSTAAQTSSIGLGRGVRVVADERNNALLIMANRRDYRRIQDALRKLDVSPTQVLIEASIIEVTLTGAFKFGLEWYFSGAIGSRTGEGLLNMNSEGGIGPQQPGLSYSVLGQGGQIRAVLNTLAQDSRLRVLSNPSLLVLDNHTATIHVGDQQPVQTGETIVDNTRSFSIEYKDTGVMLSVTPSVNAGGLVNMQVKQTVTDVGTVDTATRQRSFLQRQISSQVAVRSGESIVLGGLIRDNKTTSRGGVPGLYNLPVVGPLFGTTDDSSERTELLVVLTPRVVTNDAELRAVSEEIRQRMKGLHAFPDRESPSAETDDQKRDSGAGDQ
ncbi:MAG: type II secretion system secretin GspD [Halothiobacillaceae bacterium]